MGYPIAGRPRTCVATNGVLAQVRGISMRSRFVSTSHRVRIRPLRAARDCGHRSGAFDHAAATRRRHGRVGRLLRYFGMWPAHALTLSRIPLAVALWWAYGDVAWSVAIVVVAATTDTADGHLARWLKRRGRTSPDIGGWLDPLMDKVFVAIVLAVIWMHSHELLVIALIGARELLLVPLVAIYLARHRPVGELRADPIGKAATVAQFIALAIAVSVPSWAIIAASTAAVLGVIAVVHYVWREVGRIHK